MRYRVPAEAREIGQLLCDVERSLDSDSLPLEELRMMIAQYMLMMAEIELDLRKLGLIGHRLDRKKWAAQQQRVVLLQEQAENVTAAAKKGDMPADQIRAAISKDMTKANHEEKIRQKK
jgi:hypothetical protein